MKGIATAQKDLVSRVVRLARERFHGIAMGGSVFDGAAAGVVAVVALCWIVFDFAFLGLDKTALTALVFGITITIGVGLMALVFYSSRSGFDDAAAGEPFAQQAKRGQLPP